MKRHFKYLRFGVMLLLKKKQKKNHNSPILDSNKHGMNKWDIMHVKVKFKGEMKVRENSEITWQLEKVSNTNLYCKWKDRTFLNQWQLGGKVFQFVFLYRTSMKLFLTVHNWLLHCGHKPHFSVQLKKRSVWEQIQSRRLFYNTDKKLTEKDSYS